MSRIYFHSQHGTVEVSGRERAWANALVSDLLLSALNLRGTSWVGDPHPMLQYAPGYVKQLSGKMQYEALVTWVRVGDMPDNGTPVKGHDLFTVGLNTALVAGSDPIRLLARIHGQCEIHAFVEGQNRNWLAGIVEQGIEAGIMRSSSGWEETLTLLRSRNDEPVVTSYSACEQFPNSSVAKWTPTRNDEYGDPAYDDWYELPEEESWRLALEGLRSEDHGLEMKPDNWKTFFFDDGMNGFKLMGQITA